jgi:S-adenosylmethionine:tRNA ribosyltransferase-isomerase
MDKPRATGPGSAEPNSPRAADPGATPRGYQTSDFDYNLPPEQIAQHPLPDRSASRLLVLHRATGAIRHLHFRDLPELIPPRDVLVINTSRVIPARLHGKRDTGTVAELLLVHELADGSWLAMGHPGGKLKPGRRVSFGEDSAVEVLEMLGGGLRRVRFVGALDARTTLAKYGEVPLPPYIRRPPDDADRERYQTVYAAHDGSVAAPTAGLHFTPELLADIYTRQVRVASIDLHVGPGTFKPVETEDISLHSMTAEAYDITPGAAEWINHAKEKQRGVWAVGTTVVRALESAADSQGLVRAVVGETSLFIRPPYDFKIVDHLITNFHLPRSTLLMLVCAFGGYDRVMAAYRDAVKEGYRFYSYGDAMVII